MLSALCHYNACQILLLFQLEGGQFQEGKNAVANLSDQIRMQDVNESGTSGQAASSVPPLDLGEAIRTV